jgi:hypothetical protein
MSAAQAAPLITLDQWALSRYGEANKPHPNTLRRWAREGNIYPRPRRHGKAYMVRPEAVYVDPHNPQSLAGALEEANGASALT